MLAITERKVTVLKAATRRRVIDQKSGQGAANKLLHLLDEFFFLQVPGFLLQPGALSPCHLNAPLSQPQVVGNDRTGECWEELAPSSKLGPEWRAQKGPPRPAGQGLLPALGLSSHRHSGHSQGGTFLDSSGSHSGSFVVDLVHCKNNGPPSCSILYCSDVSTFPLFPKGSQQCWSERRGEPGS